MQKIKGLLLITCIIVAAHTHAQHFVTSSGTSLINPGGKTFRMKGTNLGYIEALNFGK